MTPRLMLACLGLLALPALATDPPRAVFVEAEVDEPSPWVQAPITYTLRAWQGVDLREPRLTGPQARLAEVRPLGPATVREAERAGRRYRVHEQRFAVLPFASGNVELGGAQLAGRPPGSSRPLRIEAPAITLRVRPVPAGVDAARWLPAEDVALSETWSPLPDAGEDAAPPMRRIRIEARGVDAAQIPELRPEIPGVRVLALPPRLDTRIEGARLIGIREQDFQLVPLRHEPLEVPALDLPWWKVGAGETAIASLPARTLDIAAPAPPATAPPTQPAWSWLAALPALAALAWLALRMHRSRWRLHWLCRTGTPAAARDAALAWGARRWRSAPPRSLPELAARLPGGTLGAALLALDARLYGPETGRR